MTFHENDRSTLFIQGQNSVKYHSTPTYIRQSEEAMKLLPSSSRKIAVEQMIEYTRGLERNHRLPKGATNKLIQDLEGKYRELTPFLKTTGAMSMHELDLAMKDRRVVTSVQKQVDAIGRAWDDAPKLAKTTAGNSRHNWQVEMDFLQKKIKTSTGQQRDDAKSAWRGLQKQGEGTSSATSRAIARMADNTASNMGGWGSTVSGIITLVGKNTNTALTALGVKPVPLSLGDSVARAFPKYVTAKYHARGGFAGKALGGWIGNPGERGQDRELAFLGRGEFVASGDQQPELQMGLRLGKMFGLGSSGSLEELARNRRVPHSQAFEKGGFAGKYATGGQVDAVRARAGLPKIFDNIAFAESGNNESVINSIGATGLWQIYGHPDLVARFGSMTNPWSNAQAAKVLYDQGGLGPWVSSRPAWGKYLGQPGIMQGGSPSGSGGAAVHHLKRVLVHGSGKLHDQAQATSDKLVKGANAKLDAAAAAQAATTGGGAAPSVGGARGPKGTGTWNGIPVANWLIDALKWAQAHGGNTQITSGYRPGFDPHAPSGSEHAGTQYPHGAIDFGDFTNPQGLANKMSFLNSLAGYGGPKPILPIGFSDFGHTSGTGHARGGFVGRVARFATGGFLTGGGQGQFGGLRPPSHHPVRRPHFAGSSQPHHGHHAPRGHVGHAGHAGHSQPYVGGAPGFLGDTRGLGAIPDLTGGPKATNPRVDAFLGSIGLHVPGVQSHGGSFLQALVGAGNIPGLSPLDTADLGVAGSANAYTQLEQHLTASEPGGQLSEQDYGQLLGVRTHGLGLLTGEQRTVAGEFHTVASAWMGRDKRLQALKARRDQVLAAQTKAQDKLKRMQRQYARLKHDRRGRMLSEADRVAGDLSKNSDQLAANMAARRAIHSERGFDAAGARARIHAKYAPLIAGATGKHNRGRRAALHAAMAQELNALSGRVRGQADSKKQRLGPLATEAARLSRDGKTIHQREAKARRKYAHDGWAGAWSETTAKWRLQDKIKHLGDEAKKLQGSAGAHTGIAGLEGEEAQLVTAASDLVQRAQQLPDAVRQGQADVATLAHEATTAQLLTPEQTNRLSLLTEQQALAALTPDTADDQAAATGIAGLWQDVLTGLQSRHAAPDLITQAAQNLLSARQGSTGITDQVRASMTQFDEQQRSLFQTFGSNFIPTAAGLGSPSLGGFANFGAGGAAQSAAMGLGPAGENGKIVHVAEGAAFVQQHFAAPPDDPHSHAALSRYAFESSF